MATLQQFFEAVDYRISEGYRYQWGCYGDNAQGIDSNSEPINSWNVGCVFDTITQEVYEISVHDYNQNLAYRWINPSYRDAYRSEAEVKAYGDADVAWDDTKYIDVETSDDILDKAHDIVHGLIPDKRVKIDIELEDKEWYALMKLAHERDMTLNELVEYILASYIESIDKPK